MKRITTILGIALPACAVALFFAWNVHHWWFVADDAFITFRYARNLVDGHGLVWNPGEAVEGYTEMSKHVGEARAARKAMAGEGDAPKGAEVIRVILGAH